METRRLEVQVKIRDIVESLTEDERRLLSGVLEAEREKLYMQKPRGINDDLWKVVTETIR